MKFRLKFRNIFSTILQHCQKKMAEPENGCGKCAVCHHVCQLLAFTAQDKTRQITVKEKDDMD